MSNHSLRIQFLLTVFLALLFSQTSNVVSAGETGTEAQIRALFDKAEAATESEDLDELVSLIHPDAPNAAQTRQRMAKILENRDLDQKVIGYHFLAEDPPYAFARAQVKWTGKGGKAFRNNITDTLYIFKKQGAEWKLWGELPLGVVVLDQSS